MASLPHTLEWHIIPGSPITSPKDRNGHRGSWGCGAWHHKAWFQIQWPEQALSLDIAQKELNPIILACEAWGAAWHGLQVLCHCDNQVVVTFGLVHYAPAPVPNTSRGMPPLLSLPNICQHQGQHPSRRSVTGQTFCFPTENARGRPAPISCLPPAPGPAAGPPGGLDVSSLAGSMQQYFLAGLAPSTHQTYRTAMKRFNAFCTTYHITNPFPLTEHLMCYYASFLADQGLATQTVKGYLSALRNMQISLGLLDPREQSSMPLLKRVQAGIARTRKAKGNPTRVRLPITPHLLRRIRQVLSRSDHSERVVLWAIACTAFFGFFWLGELLPQAAKPNDSVQGLAWGQVAVDDQLAPKMVQIHLSKSKCDQVGLGADIVHSLQLSEMEIRDRPHPPINYYPHAHEYH